MNYIETLSSKVLNSTIVYLLLSVKKVLYILLSKGEVDEAIFVLL